jgi:3-hydroxybutyrate dehydrogenase
MSRRKNALVTGSTSGIGRGIADSLAGAGFDVVLNGSRDPGRIEQERSRMEADYGVRVLYRQADMTRPEQIAGMIDGAAKELGSLDVLVNNAGIQHVAPIEEFPTEKWDAILAINLSAAFHGIRCAVKHMKRSGWGRIINVASAHALVASPHKSAYVAAKHGIAGLTKTVALEMAEQAITCNAICPGYVRTPLVEGQIAESARIRGISEEEVVRDVMLANQPTKQFTAVEDIGAMAVYLCGDAARNITGAMLSLDGGWTAH